MAKDKRFEIILTESSFTGGERKILLDTETGVQYLFVQVGNGAGLTVLVDRDGKPLTWQV